VKEKEERKPTQARRQDVQDGEERQRKQRLK